MLIRADRRRVHPLHAALPYYPSHLASSCVHTPQSCCTRRRATLRTLRCRRRCAVAGCAASPPSCVRSCGSYVVTASSSGARRTSSSSPCRSGGCNPLPTTSSRSSSTCIKACSLTAKSRESMNRVCHLSSMEKYKLMFRFPLPEAHATLISQSVLPFTLAIRRHRLEQAAAPSVPSCCRVAHTRRGCGAM